jgi:thioesterase domain-containing protein
MADDYIDQMQRVAPRFMVAGWSFGGMVAYEIARKLHAKRQLIGAPVLIDAPIGPIEKPRDNDSSLLKAYLKDLAGLFGKKEEFDVLTSGVEMTEAELLDVSNTLQIVQISERKAIQEMVEVYRENVKLAHDFRYLPYDGKLIYCANARINDKGLLTLPSGIQWNNVEVIQMSGGHYEMLSGENLSRIKAAIESAS